MLPVLEYSMARKGVQSMRMLLRVLVVLAVLLVACEGGEEAPSPMTPSPSPTVSPGSPTIAITPAPPAGNPEASLPLGKVSFSSRRDANGEIYLLTSDSEANMTNNPAEDIESDLSSDGSRIVFASNRDGTYDIYVVDVDGSGLTRLTDGPSGDFSPRWSPDGKRIAFSRGGSLMVMDSDGGNARQITEPNVGATAEPCEAGAFLGGWSPDGKQLTFYVTSSARDIKQICIINVDGSGLQAVVSEPAGYQVEPAWSPDGQWIVYRSIREGNNEIYKVRPDGSEDTNLTNNPAIDLEPDWSPDGDWIVFSSNRGGQFNLHIMKADGGDVARVTAADAKDSDPSWQP